MKGCFLLVFTDKVPRLQFFSSEGQRGYANSGASRGIAPQELLGRSRTF